MSSNNDLFEPDDFDNLIAAVDSLEIPLDDDLPSAPPINSKVENNSTSSSSSAPSDPLFKIDGDPFGTGDSLLSTESNEEDELNELADLAADFSELDFEDASDSLETFSASTSFDAPTKQVTPNELKLVLSPDEFAAIDAFDAIGDEDDLIDVYASFLEAMDDDSSIIQSDLKQDEFSEFANFSDKQDSTSQDLDYFGDDGFEVFDGVAAANEISKLYLEEENPETSVPPKTSSNAPQPITPLDSTMEKTQLAAQKLKTHLESLSNKQHNSSIAPQTNQTNKLAAKSIEAKEDLSSEFEDFFDDHKTVTSSSTALHKTPITDTVVDKPAPEQMLTPETKPLHMGDLANSTLKLSNKTDTISDNLMAAFLDSTLSSKQKIRVFSLQTFADKFPRAYLACTTILALVGILYILAIPALLFVSMFNGFNMLNSPFTNNMPMMLAVVFGISLFLFMAGYKLFDLKFVGPGGITLNHENASMLIEKLQQLKSELKTPRIHEVVLTRRHELNLIKIPRFGLPIWSKNVLTIGYPLLQTLSPEYFDVALSRKLIQFNKRKNAFHNWLSFMRRTWTIYAISLKERKGILDLLHYCFFAPYASIYRTFAVYISQKDELLADEKALHHCNDRDLLKAAQTLRITRAMLLQYFWPKLNEELQSNTSSPHYVKPYSKLPDILKTLLNTKKVDAWFIRLGQEDFNPGDPEAPFALRMLTLGQRKVAIPDSFETNAAQHYFDAQYQKMTDLLDTLWADEVQKELFNDNIHNGKLETELPSRLSIEPA